MDLQAFRVQNYKRVEDTGWINCGDLTVLVGKNESGKSAILRGLSKIKPSDNEEYDGLREFPRRRFTDEFDSRDWPVASVRLSLDADDIADLVEICPDLEDVSTVEVTKHYSGKRTVGFRPTPAPAEVTYKEVVKTADAARRQLADARAPEGYGDQLGGLKPQIDAAIQQSVSALPNTGELPVASTDALLQAVNQFMNEAWHDVALEKVVGPLREIADRNRTGAQRTAARSWVVQKMPQFVYFDRYDVLDSAVHIPTFMNQLQSTPSAPRVRTTHCLFRHVGLDVGKLYELGSHQPGGPEDATVRRRLDERSIRASSASQAMTRKFAEWWEQRRHTFRYQVDGDYLRIWVSDDLDPSEIELDQRSQGMQYFFSFFLVFLVEAEDAHANSILLLDEPGTALHGTAQAKIVQFLHKLSKDNQVLYTTHSPFMIDAEHLETVRAVYEDPATGSTKVSEDVWPKDKDALFPLQAALGYQLVQSMFLAKRQVLLEGITDYWIFKALDHALQATSQLGLDPTIILIPGGGASKLTPLASMLTGHHVDLVAILDGDQPGRREGRKLAESLLVGDTNRTLFIGDYTADGNAGGETEDLFPDDYYLQAVKTAHPGVDLRFNADEKAIDNIVDRLQSLFSRRHVTFEKWRVARALADQIEAAPGAVPAETVKAITKIFTIVNSIFGA